MNTCEFQVTRDGAIARIDLGRPDKGNALTRAMMIQLSSLVRELGNASDVHVIAIGGRGRQFCRGRDGAGESRAGMTPYDIRVNLMGATLGVFQALSETPVPVVACVHGDASGFGAGLAVGCDITLAAAGARFAFPEIEHDIPPTLGMSAALGKVSAKALAYLVYSAERIDATQAAAMGLVSKVLPEAQFAGAADVFLKTLSSRPRLVLETIKRYYTKAAQLTPDMASEYAGTLLALVRP